MNLKKLSRMKSALERRKADIVKYQGMTDIPGMNDKRKIAEADVKNLETKLKAVS